MSDCSTVGRCLSLLRKPGRSLSLLPLSICVQGMEGFSWTLNLPADPSPRSALIVAQGRASTSASTECRSTSRWVGGGGGWGGERPAGSPRCLIMPSLSAPAVPAWCARRVHAQVSLGPARSSQTLSAIGAAPCSPCYMHPPSSMYHVVPCATGLPAPCSPCSMHVPCAPPPQRNLYLAHREPTSSHLILFTPDPHRPTSRACLHRPCGQT